MFHVSKFFHKLLALFARSDSGVGVLEHVGKVLELLERGMVVLEGNNVGHGKDSEEHERDESESLARAGAERSDLLVVVLALSISVDISKVVKDRVGRSTNDRSSGGFLGSAFDESFVSRRVLIDKLVGLVIDNGIPVSGVHFLGRGVSHDRFPVGFEFLSLFSHRLGLDLLEHNVVRVGNVHEGDVVSTSHVVGRVRVVEAVRVDLLSDDGGVSGLKSRVSRGNESLLLGHFGSKFGERSDTDQKDEGSSLSEHFLNSNVVIGLSSLHSFLSFGENHSPDHDRERVEHSGHLHLVVALFSGGTEFSVSRLVVRSLG